MISEHCLLGALDFPTTRNGVRNEVLENSFSIIAATMPVPSMNAASPGEETNDHMQQSPSTEVSSNDDNSDEETDRTGGHNKRKSVKESSSANSRRKTTQKGRK